LEFVKCKKEGKKGKIVNKKKRKEVRGDKHIEGCEN
jgi:hypothetical protein